MQEHERTRIRHVLRMTEGPTDGHLACNASAGRLRHCDDGHTNAACCDARGPPQGGQGAWVREQEGGRYNLLLLDPCGPVTMCQPCALCKHTQGNLMGI